MNDAASAASALTAGLFTLALAALGLAVSVWLLLRSARARRALAEDLRATRARTQAIEPLLDVWVWHSDAQHRLVSIRPPHGAPAQQWSVAKDGGPLWERMQPDDADALRARLEAGAPLDDVPATLAGAGLLRGRPVGDALGRFAGYHGTWRPVAAGTAPAAALADPIQTAIALAPPVTPSLPPALAAQTEAVADPDALGFTISHDLRAPIRVVEGFTKIIKEDYGKLLDQVGNDHLDRVLGAAARMNNMIDALLALSKLSSQPLSRQPVDLSQLAVYVADELRRQTPERAVRFEVEPAMKVHGDPTLLRVVLENLLSNAWKYTGKTSTAAISFVRHAQDADSFSILDNGAGFDMRYVDRLFGVFQRLHSANDFPGTGVGLASVRRIVRRHGGEIWGEGEVGRGAHFHFSLPQRGAR